MKIEFYRHSLNADDKAEAMKVLDSLFLTTGEVTKEFEEKFAKYVDAKYCVGVSSCTNALFLALNYHNIGSGDEVITSPMTFIASPNAVEYCGATPVFADVEPGTGNIDVRKIEAAITEKTRAIMPVHLYGQMCDMIALREIADRHGLVIIEDCAHCVEGKRDGIGVGELSEVACYSFYATKNLTCGEGGAITCNIDDIYDYMLRARLHGMSKSAADRYSKKYQHYDMEFLGYKCNLGNLQASLMIHQLDRLDGYLERREEIAKMMDKGLEDNPHIKTPAVLGNTRHARHLYTIWVNPEKRDEYIHQFQDAGLGVAVNFRVAHLMKYYVEKYGYKKGDFPNAEKIGDSTITLPFYPNLRQEEIDYVIKQVNRIVTE